jgi:hypothetical protein
MAGVGSVGRRGLVWACRMLHAYATAVDCTTDVQSVHYVHSTAKLGQNFSILALKFRQQLLARCIHPSMHPSMTVL